MTAEIHTEIPDFWRKLLHCLTKRELNEAMFNFNFITNGKYHNSNDASGYSVPGKWRACSSRLSEASVKSAS